MDITAVTSENIVSLGIGAFCMTILPIIIVVVLKLMKKITLKPFFVGMLAFFVSQILIRIPIMNVLAANSAGYRAFISTVIGLIIVGGFTAGLFEESARLVCGKYLLKTKTTFNDAISFGLGHAFCEVVLTIGLTDCIYLLNALLINSGAFEQILAAQNQTLEAAQPLIQAISSFTYVAVALATLERVSSVAYHIFATVLIFKGINERKIKYYFLAILAHTALNSIGVLSMQNFGLLAGELITFAMAAGATVYTFKAKRNFPLRVEKLNVDIPINTLQ